MHSPIKNPTVFEPKASHSRGFVFCSHQGKWSLFNTQMRRCKVSYQCHAWWQKPSVSYRKSSHLVGNGRRTLIPVVFRILCHFDNLSKKDNTALNRLTSVNGSGAAAKSYSSFDYDTRGNITNNSHVEMSYNLANQMTCLLYTSPSPRD